MVLKNGLNTHPETAIILYGGEEFPKIPFYSGPVKKRNASQDPRPGGKCPFFPHLRYLPHEKTPQKEKTGPIFLRE